MNRKIIWILFSICIIFVLSAFTINPSTSSINLSTAKDDVVVVNYEMDKVNSEGALSLQLLLNSYGKI